MIQRFRNPRDLSLAAAGLFVRSAREAIAESGRFRVALTGGTSPSGLYRLIAGEPYRDQVDWRKVYVFWGDERWVPITDSRSNAGMAFGTLLKKVPVPPEQVFPMWTAGTRPEEAAARYQQILQANLGDDQRLDLVLLGMGEDGHTASLFPGSAVLDEREKWVDSLWLPGQQMHRITLTVPVINAARKVAVIVFGAAKADALRQVLEGPPDPHAYPSQLIRPRDGELHWLIDDAAGAGLARESP
ncbi:MAG TPA: 6-phosphogluconolactonase [Sphingobacteriaceae bacterium]